MKVGRMLNLNDLISGMNPEAIQRVAQALPNHMLHSLSQVASQTPHYPHTPGGGGYGANMHTYHNTVSACCVICIKLLYRILQNRLAY